jgi:hypothetical protein
MYETIAYYLHNGNTLTIIVFIGAFLSLYAIIKQII